MKGFGGNYRIRFRILCAGSGLALTALAGCGPKPASTPPPPPPVVAIPPQPYPPMGASAHMAVPPLSPLGVRQTVNTGLSDAQTTWNLRSAYNVAALNCLKPEHAPILTNYRAFLKEHAKKLGSVNKAVDAEFKAKHGASFIRPREAYMTQVYNYFALPPTLSGFCDAALAMSVEGQAVKSADLDGFAMRVLPQLEQPFFTFFNSYDQYRVDLAAWQARYGPPVTLPAPTVPVSSMAPSASPAGLPQ